MNNFGVLHKLIDQLSNNVHEYRDLCIALAVFVFVNLVLTGLNIFYQFRLKNKEKEVNADRLRESRRIDHQENLYKMLEALTRYDESVKGKSKLLNEISKISQYLTKEKLFLTKDIITLAMEFTDYFLTVSSDYRKRRIEFEMKILDKYYESFNNVKSRW